MVYADKTSIANLYVSLQEYENRLKTYQTRLKDSFDNLKNSNFWYDEKYVEFKTGQIDPLFDQAMASVYH